MTIAIARLPHGGGMLASTRMAIPNVPRELGAGITCLAGIGLAVAAALSW